ncbi:MAG: hypothetical protein JWQ90_142 [Hydrocarboniphaga sp.]|nr:hypothetical protein [Hydrocarboniphaga sp.]
MALPQYIKVSQGLARSEQYAGEVDPQQLLRLRLELAGPSQGMQVSLGLVRDAIGNWLRGELRGSLDLQCSRCEAVFAWPLKVDVDLRLVRSEAEAKQVLQDADPYQVDDDRLPLVEVVEDEVLLALPMLPRCQACEQAAADAPEPAPAVKAKKPNPFAQLKKELK